MLFATPAGEAHEFGLLFAAALAATAGVKTSILGSNVPARELLRAARKTLPDIIVLGVLQSDDHLGISQYCRELLPRLPGACMLWIGGHPSAKLAAGKNALRAQFIPSLEEFARKASALR